MKLLNDLIQSRLILLGSWKIGKFQFWQCMLTFRKKKKQKKKKKKKTKTLVHKVLGNPHNLNVILADLADFLYTEIKQFYRKGVFDRTAQKLSLIQNLIVSGKFRSCFKDLRKNKLGG